MTTLRPQASKGLDIIIDKMIGHLIIFIPTALLSNGIMPDIPQIIDVLTKDLKRDNDSELWGIFKDTKEATMAAIKADAPKNIVAATFELTLKSKCFEYAQKAAANWPK